jgi:hypothetical protein
MAYLDATDLYDLQASGAANEKRFSEQGLLDATKASSLAVDYILPSDKLKMQSLDSIRDVQIPVIQDQTVTVNATPGFTFIPSNLPTSAQYSFTAYDVFSGFRHYPATFDSNSIDEAAAKQVVMKNVLYAMADTVETTIATVLETRKTQLMNYTTQVSQGDGTFTFNTTPDELEVNKAAQKETMFANLTQLMEANELPGAYRIITNRAGLAVQKSEAAKYGAGNDKNLQALGFFGADRMHESGNISAGANVFEGWLIRDGAIGIIENFPYDFRNGTEVGGKKWSVSDMELPFLKMRANIYVNNEATNAEALISGGSSSDNKMTHFQEMAIWSRFYVVYPYNSDLTARVSDVVKITGLTT